MRGRSQAGRGGVRVGASRGTREKPLASPLRRHGPLSPCTGCSRPSDRSRLDCELRGALLRARAPGAPRSGLELRDGEADPPRAPGPGPRPARTGSAARPWDLGSPACGTKRSSAIASRPIRPWIPRSNWSSSGWGRTAHGVPLPRCGDPDSRRALCVDVRVEAVASMRSPRRVPRVRRADLPGGGRQGARGAATAGARGSRGAHARLAGQAGAGRAGLDPGPRAASALPKAIARLKALLIPRGHAAAPNLPRALQDRRRRAGQPIDLRPWPARATLLRGPHSTDYLSRHPGPVKAIGLGVAGAVVNRAVRVTSLPWVIESEVVAARLGLKPSMSTSSNDLVATGTGCGRCHLPALADFKKARRTRRLRGSHRGGTGLGETILVRVGQALPVPSRRTRRFRGEDRRGIHVLKSFRAKYGRRELGAGAVRPRLAALGDSSTKKPAWARIGAMGAGGMGRRGERPWMARIATVRARAQALRRGLRSRGGDLALRR